MSKQQEIEQARFDFIEPLKAGPIEFSPDLEPDKIIEDGDFIWFVFGPEKTMVMEIGMVDTATGYIITAPVPDPNNRIASIMAWAGARHSRAPGQSWNIMHEMVEQNVDADGKLTTTFQTYGHSSVADMANIMLHLEGIPMHTAMSTFNNHALNGGQEKSTRYQPEFLETGNLHRLSEYGIEDAIAEQLYLEIAERQMRLSRQYYEKIAQYFTEIFEPKNGRERNSLVARTLDTARLFMPMGLRTGMSINTSAREWSRHIADLKASPNPHYQRMALQIEAFLAPRPIIEEKLGFKAEAPGLIRHTEANSLPVSNMVKLKVYLVSEFPELDRFFREQGNMLEGRKEQLVEDLSDSSQENIFIAQRINLLYPGIDLCYLVSWLENEDVSTVKQMLEILLDGHDHHKQLYLFDDIGPNTYVLNAAISEVRDLNRHRASRRFIPLPLIQGTKTNFDTAISIVNRGYILPLYLTELEGMGEIREEIEQDVEEVFNDIRFLIEHIADLYGEDADFGFIYNLLPFCTKVPLVLHQGIRQNVYFPHLRNGLGGQVNYRQLAHEVGQHAGEPFTPGEAPNVRSRDEFFGRS